MANDAQLSEAPPALIWPSMASASAELCRPRRSRVGRAESPAVLRLVPPASVDAGLDVSVSHYALSRRRRTR